MSEPTPSRSGVGKAIARGAVWTLSIRMVNRFIGVISTLILARILMPSDFGVYGLAMSVYALIELISAFGFNTALIQKQNTTDEHYHTAWTMNFLFSLFCMLLLYAGASQAAQFLEEPRLEPVLKFMCLLFFVDALKNVGIVNFQKHMTFNKEFSLRVLVKICGFVVTVSLAFLLESYWAMLWGLLASSIALAILSYAMQPFRPRFGLSCWREMIVFSSWLQVNNVLNYFNRNTENFLLSRSAGVTAVGSLTMAKESGQLLQEVAAPIYRASFPGYARVNQDPARLCDVFCDVMGVLAITGFAVALGLSSVAHLLVPTLLGAKWVHIVPLVEYLSIASLLLVTIRSTNDVLIAMGRVSWATGIIASRLVLLVSLLLYFLPLYGVMGVAYATLITRLLINFVAYVVLRRHISLGVIRVLSILFRPAVAGVSMWLILTYLFPSHLSDHSIYAQIGQLVLAVVIGAGWYVGVLGLLWMIQSRPEGPELHFIRQVYKRTGWMGFLIPEGKPLA